MKKIYFAILIILFLVTILCLKISLTEYFQNEHFIDISSIMNKLGIDARKCENELNEFKRENSDIMNEIDKIMINENYSNINKLVNKFSDPENQSRELQNLINCIMTNNNTNMLSII